MTFHIAIFFSLLLLSFLFTFVSLACLTSPPARPSVRPPLFAVRLTYDEHCDCHEFLFSFEYISALNFVVIKNRKDRCPARCTLGRVRYGVVYPGDFHFSWLAGWQ